MDLEEWKQYYVDNIILQYKQRPKAIETIKALAGVNWVLGILDGLKGVWDIDNATSEKLNIIAQLLGIKRNYYGLNYSSKFFSTPYSNLVADSPTLPNDPREGFIVGGVDKMGEWFMNSKTGYSYLALNDDNLRKVIKMKIYARLCNNSAKKIQELLDTHFAGAFIREQYHPANEIIYYVSADDMLIFEIMRDKDILPRVAGVNAVVLQSELS